MKIGLLLAILVSVIGAGTYTQSKYQQTLIETARLAKEQTEATELRFQQGETERTILREWLEQQSDDLDVLRKAVNKPRPPSKIVLVLPTPKGTPTPALSTQHTPPGSSPSSNDSGGLMRLFSK